MNITIPEHMQASAAQWINYGRPHPRLLGSFLRAVLANDLKAAAAHADRENQASLFAWAAWLYNECPGGAQGDIAALEKWHEAGGLRGHETRTGP